MSHMLSFLFWYINQTEVLLCKLLKLLTINSLLVVLFRRLQTLYLMFYMGLRRKDGKTCTQNKKKGIGKITFLFSRTNSPLNRIIVTPAQLIGLIIYLFRVLICVCQSVWVLTSNCIEAGPGIKVVVFASITIKQIFWSQFNTSITCLEVTSTQKNCIVKF